jgi:hypothetical protein
MKPILLFLFIGITGLPSCKKFLEVEANAPLTEDKIFSSDGAAQAAIVGVYARFVSGFSYSYGYMSRYVPLYGDELQPLSGASSDKPFYQLKITPSTTIVSEVWAAAYGHIYQCNKIIEKVGNSPNISNTVKQSLLAEAKFLRGWIYFHLANLFGDLPFATTPDFWINEKLTRTPASEIYDHIIADLETSLPFLPVNYPVEKLTGSIPVRATRYAAMHLLARLHIWRGNWNKAQWYCSSILESGKFSLPNTSHTFSLTSPEIILAFQISSPFFNTAEGYYFGVADNDQASALAMTASLASTFTSNDLRLRDWIKKVAIGGHDYFIPNKYKIYKSEELKEISIVFRLAEVYLLRAEANINLGQEQDARTDINAIRTRAGLPVLSDHWANDELLRALQEEKQREFFAEWGLRFIDLKRWPSRINATHKDSTLLDDVMRKEKPNLWQHFRQVFPIPAGEIKQMPSIQQNDQY